MTNWPAWLALIVSCGALIVSIYSVKANVQSTRASLYDRRLEIYSEAEKFLGAWIRNARPDLTLLPSLVGAWGRSKFLFDQEITDYLRKIWLDAIEAEKSWQIIDDKTHGDRSEAIKVKYDLLTEHGELDNLRNKFLKHLKVEA